LFILDRETGYRPLVEHGCRATRSGEVKSREVAVLLADLVDAVAAGTGQPKTVVEGVVRSVLDSIEGAVAKGETVNLVGFGRFEVYDRGARRGRNLRTGETLQIPPTKAVRFKIGKRLRDAAAGVKARKGGKRVKR
jgi:DNA-binding protein HU-beta